MNKITLTREQDLKFQMAKRILCIFEIGLEEEGFEFILEGESMFLRTKDEQNVFKLVDLDIEDHSGRDIVILLPRTTDAQNLVPIRLDGNDL